MAGTRRRTYTALMQRLHREPYRFEFFQAVRILEAAGRWQAGHDDDRSGPVGYDHIPAKEALRFRSLPSRSFPAADITTVTPAGEGKDGAPPEVTVTFMGLAGPAGVLPEHYTDLILSRLKANDSSLRDFLDLFNHRTLSLFNRAWRKYRHPFNRNPDQPDEDTFSMAIRSLSGLSTHADRVHTDVAQTALLLNSGRYSSHARPAHGLADLLADYLGVPVEVHEFQGQWLEIEREQVSRLPSGPDRAGHFNRLGVDTHLGEHFWDVQSRFRLRIGPLARAMFKRLLPGSRTLTEVCALTRAYVGHELDFDIVLCIESAAITPCRLCSKGADPFALGWETWLAGPQTGINEDVCISPPEPQSQPRIR